MNDTVAQPALPAELTIYAAAQTRDLLLELLAADDGAAGMPFVIGAEGVAEVDAAGVQVLVALSRSLAARGRRLILDKPAQALVTACTTLGAAALLEIA